MSLIRFLYVILLVNVGVWAVELDCNGQSVLKKPIERIFSRKKRFLLLPTGASFKITVALGKAIISKVPRGLNLSIELSTYYPVPTVVEDWYIKKWKLKTTPRPKPKDTYIYIPGTNIRYPAKEATKRPPVFLRPQPLDPVPYAPAYKDKPFFSPWVSIFRRVDDKVIFFNFLLKFLIFLILQAYPLTDTVPKYNKFLNQSKWDNYGQKYSNKWSNPSSPYVNKFKQYENRGDYYRQKYSWDNQGSQSSKWYNSARNNASYWNPPRNSRVSENYYSNHEDAQDWKHYRGHRERRDIYNHFESFSSM